MDLERQEIFHQGVLRLNWPDDFMNKIICGDSLEIMKQMPDESVDMAITSPPYWGLRDYGTGPDQLGLEPTPEMYIEHLTEIFNEVKRVLKKEGTLWIVIGDTYASGGGKATEQSFVRGTGRTQNHPDYSPKAKLRQSMPKCLLMVPERLAWSLIQNGWILRNKIIWYKPNAMPSSVTDRFSNRWEYIFLFSKSQKYYFDLDAVREAHKPDIGYRIKTKDHRIVHTQSGRKKELEKKDFVIMANNPLGKNPGDVLTWDEKNIEDRRKSIASRGDFFEINTQPFPEAHFAVFPEKLCEKPIKAGCPEQVCKKCGKARERIIEKKVEFTSGSGKAGNPPKGKHEHSVQSKSGSYDIRMGPQASTKTIGWTSCNCNAGFEGGIVLDPFAGAGTALLVTKEMRRRFIGIDIKQEYCDMCEKRLAQGVL